MVETGNSDWNMDSLVTTVSDHNTGMDGYNVGVKCDRHLTSANLNLNLGDVGDRQTVYRNIGMTKTRMYTECRLRCL